jgi:hypothetical protein
VATVFIVVVVVVVVVVVAVSVVAVTGEALAGRAVGQLPNYRVRIDTGNPSSSAKPISDR